ncbi:MAG TPA: nucleoside phosphorylase [Sulfurospirillum arcachonense]|nr:nucleoside phosphorylase [Sulfurospirillum arcachonense]HIP44278.1 nucleoside phosphorylase [Sulfurospirillum arcachonense]
MILIHTALKHEAKPIIEYFRLQCIQTKPFKIYEKGNIVLAVCGMGRQNTLHVKEVFENYEIKKAINIGIAGCKDKTVKIGSIFCTTHQIESIKYSTLSTINEPLDNPEGLKTTLVDMESKHFISTCKEFLDINDIYILKVVSDHLDTSIPKKEFVWKIIEQNLKSISQVVTLQN